MENITRVKAPKFRVGRYVLNEYELRTLQVEVAKGDRKPGMKVKDDLGVVATILPNGSLDTALSGYDMNTYLRFQLLKLKMQNK
jgi:hypothetical protein